MHTILPNPARFLSYYCRDSCAISPMSYAVDHVPNLPASHLLLLLRIAMVMAVAFAILIRKREHKITLLNERSISSSASS